MYTHHQFFQLPHHQAKSLSVLYVAAVLRTFVFISFALFLPIFLLTHFSYLGIRAAIFATLSFYFLVTMTNLFGIFFATTIVSRFGLKIGLLIGQLALLLFFYLMNIGQYIPAAITFGLVSCFWWFSYHIFFLEVGNRKAFGKELGLMTSLGILTGVISPILGGLIIQFGNRGLLYLYYGVFILFSIVVILFFKDTEPVKAVRFNDVVFEVKQRFSDSISFVGMSGESFIYSVVWPILLYTIFKNYFAVGVFSSAVLFVTALAAFISGVIIDRSHKSKIKNLSMGLAAMSWIGKALFQYPFALSIFEVIYKISDTIFTVPFNTIGYLNATGQKEKYIVFRETSFRLGDLSGILVFGALTYLNVPLFFTFFFAAIALLFTTKLKTRLGR